MDGINEIKIGGLVLNEEEGEEDGLRPTTRPTSNLPRSVRGNLLTVPRRESKAIKGVESRRASVIAKLNNELENKDARRRSSAANLLSTTGKKIPLPKTKHNAGLLNLLKHLTKDEREYYKEAFKVFDEDESEDVSGSEIREVMESIDVTPDVGEVELMLRSVSGEEGGIVDLDGFMSMLSTLKIELKATEHIREAFDLFDVDRDGFITTEDLMNTFSFCGKMCNVEMATSMISAVDMDQDARVDFDDFVALIQAVDL